MCSNLGKLNSVTLANIMRTYFRRFYTFNPIQWLRNAGTISALLSSFSFDHADSLKKEHFCVVVTPWLGTDVPWFSLVSGVFLSRKVERVTFVVDDCPFGDNHFRFKFILWSIRKVMSKLRPGLRVVWLSDYSAVEPFPHIEDGLVDKLSALNAIWALKGEMKEAGRAKYIRLIRRQLGLAYQSIKTFMSAELFDVLLVPGGVYGNSGVWVACASQSGKRVASFDGGAHGVLLLCASGLASQLQDIPRALSMLKSGPDLSCKESLAVEMALMEMRGRRAGTDRFSSQLGGGGMGGAAYKNAVLLALNSSWDSAALGLHAVFDNSTQWIIETTRWILENTQCDVIVRQHPAERLEMARTSDDYRGLLTENFGENGRVHFVAADAKVNTYDLVESSSVVAVYTSTIGTEAAAQGKVVVTPSRSYYSQLGFVWKADTKAEYFSHLERAVNGEYVVSPEMRRDALLCFYLTQCCNWIATPFNPGDFPEWSKYELQTLYAQESVQLMLRSLTENVPSAFLNHVRLTRTSKACVGA